MSPLRNCAKAKLPRLILFIAITPVIIVSELSADPLEARLSDDGQRISIHEGGSELALVTHHSRPGMRPYLHPVIAPDGRGALTEVHPDHHPHQTGIYWGLKRTNGRDFFMKIYGEHYRKVNSSVVVPAGDAVSWQTVYELLDEQGRGILQETHQWTLQRRGGAFLLDLEWIGEALTEVVVKEFFVGGLFIRMPFHSDTEAGVWNANGAFGVARTEKARSNWTNVGMEIEGRPDWGHIAILSHPDNEPNQCHGGLTNKWDSVHPDR